MKEFTQLKTVYIHGRPSGHPIHDKYATLLHADFCYVDHKLRWHDIKNVSKLKRLLSWIICAITFPKKEKYDVFFTEGTREPLLIMKWLFLIKKKQKLVALMANETLYFLSIHKYKKIGSFMMRSFLKKCDAVICIGQYQAELASEFCDSKKIYTIFNGISKEKMDTLQSIPPAPNSNKIIVIAQADADWRVYYKGLDLAIEVFNRLAITKPQLELHILGYCNSEVMEKYLSPLSSETRKKIVFHGKVDITNYLKDACISLQLGKGDSFPTSTIECASAGIPTFVTIETGIKELVAKIDNYFITTLDVTDITSKVEHYLNLDTLSKNNYSNRFKQIASVYTEKNAEDFFINTFKTIGIDLGLST